MTKRNNKIFHLNQATLKAKNVGAKIAMFALGNSKELLSTLNKEAWRVAMLTMGKVKSLPSRIRIFNNLMQHVIKIYKSHGATFTISWLKGNSVALQRFIAGSAYTSLRENTPNLPLPRLINGLPGIIPRCDRDLIRKNDVRIIRFWLSLFNVYRILDAPLNPKLNTITDPYTGDEDIKQEFLEFVSSRFWKIIPPGVKPDDIKTSASYIYKSQSAGPNFYNSMASYFTDLCWWAQSEEDCKIFQDYARVSRSVKLYKKFDDAITLLFNLLSDGARIPVKGSFSFNSSIDESASTKKEKHTKGSWGYVSPQSLSLPLRGGQLALKIEAAGKVRVFALLDVWTQSILAPLHDSIFKILRALPNDGTFDQDDAFKRCQDKAVFSNSAFSVDLSSATDRLPVDIQGGILDTITGVPGFGAAWVKLLTSRGFYLPKPNPGKGDDPYEDFDLPWGKDLHYSVGQPMGALSSWGMLALTHHLIVQFAFSKTDIRTRTEWYDNYEVLGDDIVIFDLEVYNEYLIIMERLGVDCNPHKSIPSPNAQVCEFAKRTSLGNQDVSGLSWKELLQCNNLPGKINLALRLGDKLLIQSEMLLKAVLVRFGSDLTRPLQAGVGHGLVGILGSLLMKIDKKSLDPALALLVNPAMIDGEDYRPREAELPMRQAMQVILSLMKDEWFHPEQLISNYKERIEFVNDEIGPFASETAYLTALADTKQAVAKYDHQVTVLASAIIELSRVSNKILKAQVRSVAEDILLQDTDPQDHLDKLESQILGLRESMPLYEALALLKESELFSRKFDLLLSHQKGEIPTDNALSRIASNAGEMSRKYWFSLPEFQGYPELGLYEKDWLVQLKAPDNLKF